MYFIEINGLLVHAINYAESENVNIFVVRWPKVPQNSVYMGPEVQKIDVFYTY